MLINTVLVFLQNILPIFVVFSLLLTQQSAESQFSISSAYQSNTQAIKLSSNLENIRVFYLPINKLFNTTILGFICVGLLSYFLPRLSSLFMGTGIEIIFSVLFSLIYFLTALSFLLSRVSSYKSLLKHKVLVSLALLLLVLCVHGSYFSLYVMSLTIQNPPVETLYSALLIGVIIGTGICLSIAILLYFILLELNKKIKGKILCYFLLLFGVGQLMQGLQLLEQADIVSSNIHLWSTSSLIAEDSEFGYFLTILFGYEATPSAMELLVYLSAIMLPLLLTQLLNYKKKPDNSFMAGTS